ncbi:hypothetical protein F5Y17DRAFT_458918 [Xylariaceae sp. FL0594]|nr:hypothetical protein F5Y17DRAFT_458918 [Xylariaceae sp. FL0594]
MGKPAPSTPRAPWAPPLSSTTNSSNSTARERPYLVCNNISLSREDMSRYRAGWLSDTNIAFWFELLASEMLPASEDDRRRVILLNPSVAFCMMHSASLADARAILPADICQAELILVPVNDHVDVDVQGGTHWSLLVVDCVARTARHYDSLGRANQNFAARCASILGDVLGQQLHFADVSSPRQEDASSCGVFVCSVAKYIVQRVASPRFTGMAELEKLDLAEAMIDPVAARRDIQKIVISLKFREQGWEKEREKERERERGTPENPRSSPLANPLPPPFPTNSPTSSVHGHSRSGRKTGTSEPKKGSISPSIAEIGQTIMGLVGRKSETALVAPQRKKVQKKKKVDDLRQG